MYIRKNIVPFLKSFIVAKLFILSIILMSCSDDVDTSDNLDDGYKYITFTVSTPYTATTYGISAASENAVRSIDVLAFRVEGGEEIYTYRAVGEEIQDGGQDLKKEFKVSLRKDENTDYRFVVIANAAEELDELSLTQYSVKKNILSRLLSKNNDAWNSTSDSNFKPIPMWGETKNLMRITENVKRITDINLLRVLVSVDVVVTPGTQANFKLNEVYLYNRKTRGRIVPIESHFNPIDVKVTDASMPIDNPSEPLTIWEGLKYTAPNNTELKKTIYTYEAPGVKKDEDVKATCVVVGGLYKNKQTYYRLDFIEKEANGDFKAYADLLRNHRYTFTITSVTEKGYDTPDEAFFGKKIGMTADIESWSMSDVSEVEVTEDYYLKVSRGVFDIKSAEAYSGMITIQTDHPDGWSASADSWISITNIGSTYLNFSLSALPSGNREGKIIIKVGNLTKAIMIKQSAS